MSKATAQLPTPRGTALCAIADVFVRRLRQSEREQRQGPLIIQLDGPGHSEMLGKLEDRLRDDSDGSTAWTVVSFDAWQHQRLAPPWWWLVSAIEQQLRKDIRPDGVHGLPAFVWSRVRDAAWRLLQLLKDLRVITFVGLVVCLWVLTGPAIGSFMTSVAAVATASATLAVAVMSAIKPLRRRLLLAAPQADSAFMRSGDPMADLRKRYAFLLRSTGKPVLVFVDNLDRCHAGYVVELLEGLQTLLRYPDDKDEKLPFVAFVVAAERAWLCRSFLHTYELFAKTARQPGRGFGHPFLEKIFDMELRLPAIPAALSVSPARDEVLSPTEQQAITDCAAARSELELREIIERTEAAVAGDLPPRPLRRLRIAAVEQLGKLEHESHLSVCERSSQYQCADTLHVLADLVDRVDAGAAMVSRLDTAYCVQRTTQILGGHAIEAADGAIRRLGLWTILAATWPLLATHLEAHPEDVDRLRDRREPATDDADLRAVFCDRTARQLATGPPGLRLEARDITRYSTPIDVEDPPAFDVRPALVAPASA